MNILLKLGGNALAALWNDPGERVDNVGFRLVSSGPMADAFRG
jgi:hypothetical protein